MFNAWANRCMQIESVSKSLPNQDKVHDLIVELKKKFGFEQVGGVRLSLCLDGFSCLNLSDGIIM